MMVIGWLVILLLVGIVWRLNEFAQHILHALEEIRLTQGQIRELSERVQHATRMLEVTYSELSEPRRKRDMRNLIGPHP